MARGKRTLAPKPEVKEPVKVEQPEENPIKAVVSNCKKVRVRSTPTTTQNNVITELEVGTEVVLLDASNPKWSRVEYDNKRGWIMSEYLQPV